MSSDPRLGTTLAQYRMDEVLGRGGMGVVYLAYDTRLERRVALKVIAPHLAEDAAFRERFRREAAHGRRASTTRTSSRSTRPARSTGELFLAMRYVPGTDLRTLIERRRARLAADARSRSCEQVAGALDAAHARGLVHRDVKPANILIGRGGPPTRPTTSYLTDFGLTKGRAASGLTQTGQFVGTVDYIAPEQIEGEGVDGRADQYALGCVLYECLTGAVPFAATATSRCCSRTSSDEPPPARARCARSCRTAIDDVIARAMAKEPDDRYATCGEFVTAVRDGLDPVARLAGERHGRAAAPAPRRGGRGSSAAGPTESSLAPPEPASAGGAGARMPRPRAAASVGPRPRRQRAARGTRAGPGDRRGSGPPPSMVGAAGSPDRGVLPRCPGNAGAGNDQGQRQRERRRRHDRLRRGRGGIHRRTTRRRPDHRADDERRQTGAPTGPTNGKGPSRRPRGSRARTCRRRTSRRPTRTWPRSSHGPRRDTRPASRSATSTRAGRRSPPTARRSRSPRRSTATRTST